jgi:HSP20 family protein
MERGLIEEKTVSVEGRLRNEEAAMNITRWEPFREMEEAFRHYSPFFSRALRRGGEEGYVWTPVANVTETDKEFLIKAELPDVKKEDINVNVADGAITLSGERKYEKEQKNENEIRIESFYGTFARTFALPENVDTDAIEAETKDGVLRIRIPKMEEAKSKPVKIEVR